MTTVTQRGKGERLLLIAASVVVVVAGLRAAAPIAVPFVVAAFLAVLSLPLLTFLQRHHVPSLIAVLVTVVADLALVAAIGVIVSGSVQGFMEVLPTYLEAIYNWMTSTVSRIEGSGVDVKQLVALERLTPSSIMDFASRTVSSAARVLSSVVLVFLTVIFILSEALGFRHKVASAFGVDNEALGHYVRVGGEIQRFLAIKTLVSLATGLAAGVLVAVLGIDFPALWGLLAFLLNYIPNLGSIIAAIPPIILAALQHGPATLIGVAAGYLAINIVIGSLVEPHLMGRKLGLSPLVVFGSLVFWGWLWGPVGMLLSVPLTMVVKIFFLNTEDLRWVAVLLASDPDIQPVDGAAPPDTSAGAAEPE